MVASAVVRRQRELSRARTRAGIAAASRRGDHVGPAPARRSPSSARNPRWRSRNSSPSAAETRKRGRSRNIDEGRGPNTLKHQRGGMVATLPMPAVLSPPTDSCENPIVPNSWAKPHFVGSSPLGRPSVSSVEEPRPAPCLRSCCRSASSTECDFRRSRSRLAICAS